MTVRDDPALRAASAAGYATGHPTPDSSAELFVEAARPFIEADLRRKLAAKLVAAAPSGPLVLDTDEARHIQTRRGAFYDAARLILQEEAEES